MVRMERPWHGSQLSRESNKERLYNYFGDKRRLFEAVLIEELEKLAIALGAKAPGLQDIGESTGCIFDYHAEHPQLVRLLLWESLAGGAAVNEAARTAHYQRTVAMFAEAQRDGTLNDDLDPAKLVFLLIGLAAWWFAVPQLSRMVTGADASASTERGLRRTCVVSAAQHLASPPRKERLPGRPEDVGPGGRPGEARADLVTAPRRV